MPRRSPQIGLFDVDAPRRPAPEASAPAAVSASAAAEAPEAVATVSELTARIKGLLEGALPRVVVSGEISNCRRQSSGHLYFTLKDAGATLGGVLWRASAQRLRFEPKDGLEVVCHGRIELYPPHGKYQLIAERMEPLGAGALALAFEQLKERLEKEGLFDPRRKRPLPFLPRRIGVVTSPTGAALRDFLRLLHLRFPRLPVLIAPAKVQGEGAAEEIARAVDAFSERGEVDVVVVTRGGGSMEDLWAFNEEVVARAIARCRVPVVSAVGHEIDFTIADFAADRRAPTPTGAAEILAPVRADLAAGRAQLAERLRRAMLGLVSERRQKILRLQPRLGDPRRQIADRRLGLAELEDGLAAGARTGLDRRRQALRALRERLDAASPRAQLLERLRSLGSRRVAIERAGRSAVGLEPRRLALAGLRSRVEAAGRRLVQERREGLRVQAARLEGISPQRVFERGYSLTRSLASGEILRSRAGVAPGEAIEVVLGLRQGERGLEEEKIEAVVSGK